MAEKRVNKDRRKAYRREDNRRKDNRGIVDRRGNERRFDVRRDEDRKQIHKKEENNYVDQVEGRNAVLELLDAGKDVNKIYITKGEKHGSINKIIAIAKERKIIIVEKDKKQMEEMAQNKNYQGVIAIVPPFEYSEVEDILDYAREREENPFILILDGIEDTHNLGAIVRTAETAGVHGIIIPKRRAVAVNSTVSKVSCGAVEHMKIARVNNISDTIEKLKNAGLWICGTAIDAEKYCFNQDLTGPLGIVIGNEGRGISELVKKKCDFLVKIPMKGRVTSLNASVSSGIIIYEAFKQREF